MRTQTRIIILLAMVLPSWPKSAFAWQMGLGLSAIEEGDNRIRPGVLGHVGIDDYYGRMFIYGRKSGPVTERTILINASRKIALFKMLGIDFLRASAGVVMMNEQIVIDIPDDPASNRNENQFNLGGTLGIHAAVPIPGPVFVQGSWESHIFLAGAAGILLSNARKQIISLIVGINI